MALKYHIAKLEDVEEAQRPLYIPNPDTEAGGFRLAVEGVDDAGELKRARDHEKRARTEAEKKLKELQDGQKAADEKMRKAAEDAARAAGDTAKLDESWKKKYDDALAAKDAEYKPQIEAANANLRRLLIDNEATRLANEMATPGHAALLLPHIRARLEIAERDGQMVTVVVDADRKPSALTLPELAKEFKANPAFAPVIVGSKGSGGGAGGANPGGAGGNKKQLKRTDFDALTPAARDAFFKEGGALTD